MPKLKTHNNESSISKYINKISRLVDSVKNIESISLGHTRKLMRQITALFKQLMTDAGHDRRQITRITTKFRDAGRRSAPWKPTSSRVPGRPQDGKDGNRIIRWELPNDHKFYADEKTATLVEIKYYLQALSMDNAPVLPPNTLQHSFSWLLEHPIIPGTYLDPIQLIGIDLNSVVKNAKEIQSGHLIPLDRDGRHEPRNAFLMLARSNQLQGNLTLEELLALMKEIINRHNKRSSLNS